MTNRTHNWRLIELKNIRNKSITNPAVEYLFSYTGSLSAAEDRTFVQLQ